MKTLTESIYESQIDESKLGDIAKSIQSFVENNDTLQKLKNISLDLLKKAGKAVVINVLSLWYVMMDKSTPIKDKMIIMSALIYVIAPVDAIFDAAPGGFVDDVAMIGATIDLISKSIQPRHREQAEETFNKWFPDKEKEVQ